MVLVSAVCGVLVAGLLLPVASLVGLSARNVANGFENLPLDLEEEPTPQRTTVLDSRGRPLAYFYDQNRTDVPLEDVAPVMQQAILAIEDSRFYEHGAIDVRGTLRAFVNNAADGATQGGSSITQQLVKQILVTQAETPEQLDEATETSYSRKLRELQYAMAYEREYSKDQILESYLNIAYFGDSAYGIQEAAQHYFSVDAADLNVRQSATLAGLVQNPSAYNPTRFPDAATERRNIVLARMAQLDLIREQQAERIIGWGLGLDVTQLPNGCVSTRAPFFCTYAQNFLLADEALGETPQQRREMLDEGGLTISTTIDLRFQREADTSVSAAVYPTDKAIGALAMVEPRTGEVRAIAQSRPIGSDVRRGETYLNYVVADEYGDANGFQAGSTFKAFTLAEALRQGYPPDTSLNASPTLTMPSGAFQTCDGFDTERWSLANSTSSGYMSMYQATRESVNTYFAKLEELVGLCEAATLARAMGMDIPESDEVGPFTLGVTDVSPLEVAAAYATFPARGRFCEPHPISEVRDNSGAVINSWDGNCRRVMKRDVADTVNKILSGVQAPGGFGYSNASLDIDSAAKTGTVSKNKAVWYAGYTPDLAAAAVLAGANRQGTQLTLVGQTVAGESLASASGSALAAPIWGDAMRVIQRWLPGRDFVRPDTSSFTRDGSEDPPYVPPPFVPPPPPESPPIFPFPTPDPDPETPDPPGDDAPELPGDGSPDDPRPAPDGPGGQED